MAPAGSPVHRIGSGSGNGVQGGGTAPLDCLMYMLEEMDDEGEPRYFISPEWARRGMPTFYEEVFKDSCEKGCLTFRSTKAIWKDMLFKDPRI